MRKLLFITFICSSLCAYAQSEIPEDTIKNRPPVKKEQIPFSPKENKRTGLDESQPQQSLQGEQQEEINLHLPPSDYVDPLPWTDMKKPRTYRRRRGRGTPPASAGCGSLDMAGLTGSC